jgi:hypothetical protein
MVNKHHWIPGPTASKATSGEAEAGSGFALNTWIAVVSYAYLEWIV